MPSDVSMKIARRMLHECFDFGNTIVEANAHTTAEFLDSMGVGDAFEAAQQVMTAMNCKPDCTCHGATALRKAGITDGK